jgi:hypothetical protein
MGLNYNFKKAAKIIVQLSLDDLIALEKICREIQAAENALNRKGEEHLVKCLSRCEGLCCRNIRLDEIISLYDFIYFLTVQNSMRAKISKCLESEDPFYPADCLFLTDGKGPCIFPSNARAAVCITTFCSNDASIKREIQCVKRKFIKLNWFILTRKPRALIRSWLTRIRFTITKCRHS